MDEQNAHRALTKAAIFAAPDIQTERVDVPEWGGYVFVRGLTGYERDQWESTVVGERKDNKFLNYRNYRARLLVLCIVDEQGQRVFDDKADIDRLGDKSARALSRVLDVAERLSGIRKEDVEDMTRNLETTRNGDSTSA